VKHESVLVKEIAESKPAIEEIFQAWLPNRSRIHPDEILAGCAPVFPKTLPHEKGVDKTTIWRKGDSESPWKPWSKTGSSNTSSYCQSDSWGRAWERSRKLVHLSEAAFSRLKTQFWRRSRRVLPYMGSQGFRQKRNLLPDWFKKLVGSAQQVLCFYGMRFLTTQIVAAD